MISILFAFDYVEKIVKMIVEMFKIISFCSVLYLFFLAVAIGTMIYGGYCLISVHISRTNIKEFSARGVNLDSLVFFESIAKNSTYQMYKEKLTE